MGEESGCASVQNNGGGGGGGYHSEAELDSLSDQLEEAPNI